MKHLHISFKNKTKLERNIRNIKNNFDFKILFNVKLKLHGQFLLTNESFTLAFTLHFALLVWNTFRVRFSIFPLVEEPPYTGCSDNALGNFKG